MESTNELMQQRIDKIQDFRDHGIEPYPYRYDPDTTAEQVLATHSETTNEPNMDKKVFENDFVLDELVFHSQTF